MPTYLTEEELFGAEEPRAERKPEKKSEPIYLSEEELFGSSPTKEITQEANVPHYGESDDPVTEMTPHYGETKPPPPGYVSPEDYNPQEEEIVQEPVPQEEPFTPAPERNLIGDIGANIGRAFTDTGELTGQAMKVIGAEDAGQALIDYSTEAAESDYLKPDESEATGEEGFVKRGLLGGVRSSGPSLGSRVIGAAGGIAATSAYGALTGTAFSPIGTVIGAIVGATLGTGVLFGLGTYGREKDAALEKGLSEQDAHDYAKGQALVEGGIESATVIPESIIWFMTGGTGAAATQPLKQSVKQLLKTPAKELVKKYMITAGIETSTEMLQSGLGNELAKKYNMDEVPTDEAILESIIPALTMSLMFGMAGDGFNRMQKRSLQKTLSDPLANKKKRLDSAKSVYNVLQQKDQELADGWALHAATAIENGEAINLDESFVSYAASQNETQEEPPGPIERAVGQTEAEPTQEQILAEEDAEVERLAGERTDVPLGERPLTNAERERQEQQEPEQVVAETETTEQQQEEGPDYGPVDLDTIEKEYPGSKVTKRDDIAADGQGDVYEVTTPAGATIFVNSARDEIVIQDKEKLDKDYSGVDTDQYEDQAVGSFQMTGRNGLIELVKDPGEKSTLRHETLHAAKRMVLTKREIAALDRILGTEEEQAIAYQNWRTGRAEGLTPRTRNIFQKIYDYVRTLIHTFRPTALSTFEAIESGRVWEREQKSEQGPKGVRYSAKNRADVTKPEERKKSASKLKEMGATVISDNPGGEWLAQERKSAERRKKDGSTYMGATTYVVRNVGLPPKVLADTPGLLGEHTRIKADDARVKELMKTLKKEGFDKDKAIFVNVDYEGNAFINEGNHRIRAAAELGMDSIPAWVSYYAGGERQKGPWDLATVAEVAVPLTDSPKYSRKKKPEFKPVDPKSKGFKRWFKGSKVVDENGEPLVVYHGTSRFTSGESITQFELDAKLSDYGDTELGFFFSGPEVASNYADNQEGLIIPVYLSIKNPYIMKAVDYFNIANDHPDWYAKDFVKFREDLIGKGYDGIKVLKDKKLDSNSGWRQFTEDNYIAFFPAQIKSSISNTGAFSDTNPDIRYSRKKDRNYEPPTTKDGKYKGTPPGIKTRRDLVKQRKFISKLRREGKVGRYWYENSAKRILELVNGNVRDAELLTQLIAIYSAQANVDVNTHFAIKAWEQYKRGVSQEEFHVKTKTQDKKAVELLFDDTPWDGRKTNSFYLNLMNWISENRRADYDKLNIDPETRGKIESPVTVDMWMYRAFGYPNEGYGDDKASGAYSFVENETKRLAAILGWSPHQAQAAIWTAMKARYEDPIVKDKTWNESFKKGLATKNEKGQWQLPKGAEAIRKHRAIWRKNAMALTSEQATANANEWGADFSTFFDRATSVVTWEAYPSTALGYTIENVDSFTDQARAIILDGNHDLLAERLGVALAYIREGAGAYMGAVSPNTLSHLVPVKGAGKFTYSKVRTYARALQFIFRQDAVPFFRADNRVLLTKAGQRDLRFKVIDPKSGRTRRTFATQKEAQEYIDRLGGELRGSTYARAVRLKFDREIDRQFEQKVLKSLQGYMGEDAGFTRVSQDELAIVNFRDDTTKVPFVEDETFLDQVQGFVDKHGKELGITENIVFHAEGEYGHVQDWESDPQGQTLINDRGFAKRPDLQSWLRSRQRLFDQLLKKHGTKEEPQQGQQEVNTPQYSLKKRPNFKPVDTKPKAQPAGNWYSPAVQAIRDISMKKGSGQQFWNMIKKAPGVKAEELEWMGMEEWLTARDKVTRDEVMQFAMANGVQVQEVVKGQDPIAVVNNYLRSIEGKKLGGNEWEAYQDENGEIAYEHETGALSYSLPTELARPVDKLIYESEDSTKFSEYVLPGGERYRELLLTLPVEEADAPSYSDWLEEKGYGLGGRTEHVAEYQREYPPKDQTRYTTSHWDEPNVLAHIRFNERTDADGNRVLFIEEVQSDWHQEGRRKGYFSEKIHDQLMAANRKYSEAYMGLQKKYPRATTWDKMIQAATGPEMKALMEIKRESTDLSKKQGEVPDAPFKKSWPLLSMKRMIRYASENGFDKIAWASGEQQADRYDLSKRVNEIRFAKTKSKEDTYILHVYGKRDEELYSDNAVPENKLEEIIGKEAAEKIIEQQNGTLTGLDLKVGGEGMKKFYDAMLPSAVQKFIKKFGAKVEPVEIDSGNLDRSMFGDLSSDELREEYIEETGDESGAEYMAEEEMIDLLARRNPQYAATTQLSFPITDKMRTSAVREGMPLFSLKKIPGLQQSPVDFDAELREFRDMVKARMKLRQEFKTKVLADEGKRILSNLVTPAGNVSKARVASKLQGYEKVIAKMKDDKLNTEARVQALKNFIAEFPRDVKGHAHVQAFYPRLVKAKTEEKQIKIMAEAIARIDRINDNYLRKESIKGIKDILKKNRPKTKGAINKQEKGWNLNQELEEVKRIINLPENKLDEEMQALEALLDSGQTYTEKQGDRISVLIAREASGKANEGDMMELRRMLANGADVKLRRMHLYGGLETRSGIDAYNSFQSLKEEVKQTKLEWLEQMAAARIKLVDRREKIENDVSGGQAIAETSEELNKLDAENQGWWNTLKNQLRGFDDKHQSWEWMLEKLSRFTKDGIFQSYLVKDLGRLVNESTMKEQSGISEYFTMIQDVMAKIWNVKPSQLTKARKGDEIIVKSPVEYTNKKGEKERVWMSKNMAYKRWMEWQDITLRDQLELQGWNQESIDQAWEWISPELRLWATWQLNEFYQDYHDGSASVFRQLFNTELAKTPNYSPIRRLYNLGKEDQNLLQKNTPMANIYTTATKQRVNNNRPIMLQDGDEVLGRHISEMEHFKAWGIPMRELRTLLGGEKVRRAIKQYHGQQALQVLDNFMDDFARGRVQQRFASEWMNMFRRNFTTGAVGANPVVFVKQLTSVPAYAMDMPFKEWAKGLADMNTPGKARRAYRTLMKTEFMKERYKVGFERDMILAIMGGPRRRVTGGRTLADRMMILTKLGDRFAIVYGGWPVYEYHRKQALKAGKSEAEANKIAEKAFVEATSRTQQAGQLKDQTQYQRGGDFARLFTMFYTAPSAYYRSWAGGIRGLQGMSAREWGKLLTGRGDKRRYAAAKRVFFGQVVLPAMFMLASNGGEWDDDDMLKAVLLGPISGLFMIRDFGIGLYNLTAGQYNFQDPGLPPLFSTVGEAGNAINQFNRHRMDFTKMSLADWIMDPATWEYMQSGLTAGGNLVGVPLGPLTRSAEGIYDTAKGRTVSPLRRPIGFSEKKLDQTKRDYQKVAKKLRLGGEGTKGFPAWKIYEKQIKLLNKAIREDSGRSRADNVDLHRRRAEIMQNFLNLYESL